MCCKRHFLTVSCACFSFNTRTAVWAWLSATSYVQKQRAKPPFELWITSSWSPSRTLWGEDPFGEGSWTQDWKCYPRCLPCFLQTKPIEHRLLHEGTGVLCHRGFCFFLYPEATANQGAFCQARPITAWEEPSRAEPSRDNGTALRWQAEGDDSVCVFVGCEKKNKTKVHMWSHLCRT